MRPSISVICDRLGLGLWFSTLVCLASLAAPVPADCADLPTAAPTQPPAPALPIVEFAEPGNQFEGRFGVFAAGIGSVEQGTFDLNGSLLTPRLNLGVPGYAAYALPRLQLGGAVNLEHRTSFAYADVVLTLPFAGSLFFEPFLGGAIHNGSLTPTPTLSALGCPLLFHTGFSFGMEITEHWTARATFEHLSNGKELGVNCGTNQAANGSNQGLNNYGVSIGYAF